MIPQPVRIAHITDMHLLGDPDGRVLGIDPFAAFERVLALIAREDPRPDIVIASGDLSDDGSAESYRRLRAALLEIGVPVHCVPGNHDLLDPMREHLIGDPIHLTPSVAIGAWRIVLLNSQVPGQGHGRLDPGELEILRGALEDATEPHALLCLHHPPLDLCSMPICRLENAAEVLELAERHPSLRVVIAGHVHLAHDEERGSLRHLVTPSTVVQGEHPSGPDVPEPHMFAKVHRLDTSRRGFRRLDLHADGSIETEVLWDVD